MTVDLHVKIDTRIRRSPVLASFPTQPSAAPADDATMTQPDSSSSRRPWSLLVVAAATAMSCAGASDGEQSIFDEIAITRTDTLWDLCRCSDSASECEEEMERYRYSLPSADYERSCEEFALRGREDSLQRHLECILAAAQENQECNRNASCIFESEVTCGRRHSTAVEDCAAGVEGLEQFDQAVDWCFAQKISPELTECADYVVDGALGDVLTTHAMTDKWDPDCLRHSGSADVGLAWVAPHTGWFQVSLSTDGAPSGTLVRARSCLNDSRHPRRELFCDFDDDAVYEFDADAGQTYLFFGEPDVRFEPLTFHVEAL